MVIRQYGVQGRAKRKIVDFIVGWKLSNKFSSLTESADKLLWMSAHSKSASNAYFYGYAAPLLADLFLIYNSNKSNVVVLIDCIESLQNKAAVNPVAAELLKQFYEIADSVKLDYEEVAVFK